MKSNSLKMSAAISILMLSTAIQAGTVTIPNTFSSGSAAVAQEVNDNFTAIKTAVDDNDSSINSNGGNISTNTTNITSNTADIAALQASTGFASVSAFAFQDEDASRNCRWTVNVGTSAGYYAVGGDADCDPVAGIQLPHGVTVKSLSCTVYDNTTANNIQSIRLLRVGLTSGSLSTVFVTGGSVDASGLQKLTDSTVPSSFALIDNSDNVYNLEIRFGAGTDVAGGQVTLKGCTVSY